MKNTIRCCISCILPCGALDVIRIVHSDGRVEELTGRGITASEIMEANPKHVLKKPSSVPSSDGVVHKIVVVPPHAELQRGKIYFLMPVSGNSEKTRSSSRSKKRDNGSCDGSGGRRNKNLVSESEVLLSDDQYLSEILSEKVSTLKDRRRGRIGVWRPHLESICESPIDFR